MKRLTNDSGICVDCDGIAYCKTDCLNRQIYDKLKYYEDLEEQEKLVELPCKIGDIVWTYLRAWNKEDGVAPYQITNLTITQNKKGVWTKKYRAMWVVEGKTRDWSVDFSFNEIGERVFLTKEEAEFTLGNYADEVKDNG